MATLADILREHRELSDRLASPIPARSAELKRLGARKTELDRIVRLHQDVLALRDAMREHEQLLSDADADVRTLAAGELLELRKKLERAEDGLQQALRPQDPHAGKDVVMEIRAGAGGEEAAIFATELFSMYARFAERRGWRTRLVSESRTDLGGYKEVIFEVAGSEAYGTLRHESGVHRIQRIPATEKSERIHTSTATVAVLPAARDVEVQIRPEDLRVDTFRAGGHGGQNVQKTASAVRITHLPTGLVVQCQDERSQQKNRERALGVLRSRLLARQLETQERTAGVARRAQIGTGDRSEKIRTYNMPQNRITDHRIKKSWHNVADVLNGNLDAMVGDLRAAYEARADGTASL